MISLGFGIIVSQTFENPGSNRGSRGMQIETIDAFKLIPKHRGAGMRHVTIIR